MQNCYLNATGLAAAYVTLASASWPLLLVAAGLALVGRIHL